MTEATPWARFWAADLHTHTPASGDVADEGYGDAIAIVQAAVAARLDCIAVTDHNTAAWCDDVAEAAKDTDLVVLPGVELSTPDGHLLGVWEQGTARSVIEDVLVEVGINRAQQGQLDVNAKLGMIECAARINASGGIAIAAHIEKERGVLRLPVQTHVNTILASAELSGLEYVNPETPQKVADKLGDRPSPAFVQGSDCWNAAESRHVLSGIGLRRTWIKASRPDLCGLRHALDDPDLRVRLTDPATTPSHPIISRVAITSGFLSGVSIDFSPDLNCLLGGTGAGKSLVLEAIRFTLDQQVDGAVFPQVRDEVDRRLQFALEEGGQVSVEVAVSAERYRFVRTYGPNPDSCLSYQLVGAEWVEVGIRPSDVLSIAAFSQGEVLEYARQPVGRVGLIDAHLDLTEVESRLQTAETRIAANSRRLLRARSTVATLTGEAAKVPDLSEQVRKLAEVFDSEAVKRQGAWTKEQSALNRVRDDLGELTTPTVPTPPRVEPTLSPAHDGWFAEVNQTLVALEIESAEAVEALRVSIVKAQRAVADVRSRWQTEFNEFKVNLDRELAASGSTSLPALRAQLERLQTSLDGANSAAKRLEELARPELKASQLEREDLLNDLKEAREARRAMRRSRVADLNRKTSSFVRLDIPRDGDTARFREALNTLKVGSRVREDVLDTIAKRIHPYRFVRELLAGDVNALVDADAGVNATDIGRLLGNIDDRNLWEVLLAVQTIENPDVLDVKFKKPEDGSLTSIDNLSHGQKCTAILVILLADGYNPVMVDQPEDALHAPWIEEYLVDQLRNLRGSRQYIFATRSPGLVVSADAEQIVTMKASAGRGECEAMGSLERHDLNKLALHHLEGGPTPFKRRTRKLRASIRS